MRPFIIFSATLKAVPHCLQKEQELRVGDVGLRGTMNMGGRGFYRTRSQPGLTSVSELDEQVGG